MAKISLNPIMERFRGKLGDLVFRRYQNETVVCRRPDLSGVEPTPAQAAVKLRFRQAAAYASGVFADPLQKEVYQALAENRGIPAFALALTDFLKPPTIGALDLAGYAGRIGDVITVEASDDVEVTGVVVTVRDRNSAVIEQGAATKTGERWQYTATTAVAAGESVTVEAAATDRPGHSGTKSVLVALP